MNKNRLKLDSPTKLPKAASFLWNNKMMIHMNCRGYAVSQFMQPEPAKYSHAPNLEAKTFMQPEQPYYKHHPGRFFYLKKNDDSEIFSVPYEPVRSKLDKFEFAPGTSDIKWFIENSDLAIELTLSLPQKHSLELWSVKIKNISEKKAYYSLYPYFTIGYMSWMNQSGLFNKELNSIIGTSVTPYQKYQDWDKIKNYKDKTFLCAEKEPVAYEVNSEIFEGEGGLHNPDSIKINRLCCSDAVYETPVAVMQYDIALEPEKEVNFRFIFGPAKDEVEILELKKYYFGSENGFLKESELQKNHLENSKCAIQITTPDTDFDNFVNVWLPRQVLYHGETNRLSTDPQTRNYLQDNMGMTYIDPTITRKAFIHALKQQEPSGAMPDGILLNKEAELKYINMVPHTDHCVWLPVCLKAYIDETADYEILNEKISYSDNGLKEEIYKHIEKAIRWLLENRDERNLIYINQGDWCDPMNMVGYKGKGVSGWLSIAAIYAINCWDKIKKQADIIFSLYDKSDVVKEMKKAIDKYFWDGDWYGRGRTDNDVLFGTKKDKEGSIFLNPQSWALLSGIADKSKQATIVKNIKEKLETPYGIEMFAPPFNSMREDVGRVTQKHPGSAENGSVYNHASTFYIYALYIINQKEDAFNLLKKMIPGSTEKDLIQRGQLPNFIPNYYRGAFNQFPRTAGRSSHLFNTGTAHWYYRILVEGMFGLKGTGRGLSINPKLPKEWNIAKVIRIFRNAKFEVKYTQNSDTKKVIIIVNGKELDCNIIENIVPGFSYEVEVIFP